MGRYQCHLLCRWFFTPALYAEDPDFYRNMRIQDLTQGIHKLIRQYDLLRLMLQAFDVLPDMTLTPAARCLISVDAMRDRSPLSGL